MRKSEYAHRCGRQRRYIKGQKYTLLSRRESLSLDGNGAPTACAPREHLRLKLLTSMLQER